MSGEAVAGGAADGPRLRVLAAGLQTTVQDLGRPGYQRQGIPPSGPLDHVGLRAANLLVGNTPGTAALEIAYAGPTLAVEADSVRIALAGAAATIVVLPADGGSARTLAANTSARLVRGERLCIGALADSAVAYLAVEGGFALAPVLGSLATLVRAGIGGLNGRALREGDALPLCLPAAAARGELVLTARPPPVQPAQIRVVLGPQDDHFTEHGIATLFGATYTITGACDRMGMRLSGPPLEHSAKGANIVSDGIATGAIQVPGDRQPIVLLADRQTTGGYPKIATVISADLPALGRLTPGGEIVFIAVAVAAAEEAARRLAEELDVLPQRLRPVAALDAARLLGENLVSGMVDALRPLC
jgi:biotin-dependent carboxylase-like uncharacterized protein